ncbi:acyltransferase [Cellulomonas marina]|uniref:Maltose O-acetyltransferase n=1 Tax=Cellulomonas marina TaxID=988821 RepID=A0A1I1AC41_9CELL|nr:acyltransferase [Cellulomonas marina]GIG29751.1 hypothetical protein Cma02nite_23510 [Cellulomonas marina]SFB35565.1 maltose O-acetyltransferase/hypothetical protein [Cellulomonas marina]
MRGLAALRRRARGLEPPPDPFGADPAVPGPPPARWSLAVNVLSMWTSWSPGHRAAWLRLCGVRLGPGVLVQPCHIGSPRVVIGERSYIGVGCTLDARDKITIGARVALGDEVMLLTSTHALDDPAQRAGTPLGRPVHVGDGCWLGARVTVLPGVTIGEGCVVATGAVVVRDCAPHGLYAGVPARRVRDLPTDPPAQA